MNSKKSLYLCILLWASSAPAQTLPWSPSGRVQIFAECAGRYAALADHERFVLGAAGQVSVSQQKTFEDLLTATLPDALDWGMPGEQALQWRIGAKAATASLLHSQTFSFDARRAELDQAAAEASLKACDRLIGT